MDLSLQRDFWRPDYRLVIIIQELSETSDSMPQVVANVVFNNASNYNAIGMYEATCGKY